MSGPSKWANIRVRKGAQDAKRGKIFTRHARLIEMAARGGPDPSTNASLRSAIDAAKVESVPNANIERAIKKGSGELKGEAMQEVTYEAYLPLRSSEGAKGGGPGGAAFIIECLTDNKNRTLGNVKLILSKTGGRFAESGSVAWMFMRKGAVTASRNEQLIIDNEQLDLRLIDLGVEDIQRDGGVLRVLSDAASWTRIRDALKDASFEIASAGLEYVPSKTAPVNASDMAGVERLIDALEEDDDISTVHTNAVPA